MESSHQHDAFFKAGLIFVICFFVLYCLSEIIPFELWWYFPLERKWEYAAQPSAGLKMGWYGKILLSILYAVPASLAGYIIFRQFKQKSKEVQAVLDLITLSVVVFTLYFMAYSMATREIKPPPPPLHSHEPLEQL